MIKIIYLTAGLFIFSLPQISRGEDPKPAERPNREELREKFKNLTPEERAAKIKEMREKNSGAGRGEEMQKMFKDLDLNMADLQKLSPEERRAKIKEAAEKKTAELQKKKSAGTLTDAEKETLQRIEQRRRMMEGRGGDGAPGPLRKRNAEKPANK